jgi:hypothetical protein
VKAQHARQVAGDAAPAQVGFRHRARDGPGFAPEPFGLRCPIQGFGLRVGFALGQFFLLLMEVIDQLLNLRRGRAS